LFERRLVVVRGGKCAESAFALIDSGEHQSASDDALVAIAMLLVEAVLD
jgi:hypothetical protein